MVYDPFAARGSEASGRRQPEQKTENGEDAEEDGPAEAASNSGERVAVPPRRPQKRQRPGAAAAAAAAASEQATATATAQQQQRRETALETPIDRSTATTTADAAAAAGGSVAMAASVTTVLGAPPLDDRIVTLASFIAEHLTEQQQEEEEDAAAVAVAAADDDDDGSAEPRAQHTAHPTAATTRTRTRTTEIEAKLGTLFDVTTHERAFLPACDTVTPLSRAANAATRFESTVSQDAFQRLNATLNAAAERMLREHGARVEYTRAREIDVQYSSGVRETTTWRPDAEHGASEGGNGGREAGHRRQMRKTRLDTLNMLCPHHLYDVRFSAAREEKLSLDEHQRQPLGRVQSERQKDRLSYRFRNLSVDITVVRPPAVSHSAATTTTTYEVEAEIVNDAELLRACAAFRRRGDRCRDADSVEHSALIRTAQLLFYTVVGLNDALVAPAAH